MARYAVVDDLVPDFVTRGEFGVFLSKWLERIVFSTSAGTGTSHFLTNLLTERVLTW